MSEATIRRLGKALDVMGGTLRDLPGGDEIFGEEAVYIVKTIGLRYEDHPTWHFWKTLREYKDDEYDPGWGLDPDELGLPPTMELYGVKT